MEYTVMCAILGIKGIFSVKINKNEPVSELKNKIKPADPIGASALKLYKINIPVPVGTAPNTLIDSIHRRTIDFNGRDELEDPFCELSTIPGEFPQRHLHILVEVPAVAPTTSPIPYSPKLDEEIQYAVSKFTTSLRTTFEIFLNNNVQLPLWQPPLDLDLPEETRRHIVDLKMPTICPSSSVPSLLFHNLGQPSHDPQLAKRVDELFRPEKKTKFVCNTSGSGKTRLLLEGLWRNWGFYFTARTQPDGVGSSDLERVQGDILRRLTKITDMDDGALDKNKIVAGCRFQLLLYARFVCFRVFLECAAAKGGIEEKHKGSWLLIQVAPEELLKRLDIFLEFTVLAGRATYSYLERAIIYERKAISDVLQHEPTLFCVLDEAQALPKNMDYFRSDSDETKGRPILRPIILEWRSILPNLIVSGTGISMREVGSVIGSAVGKVPGSITVTEIGGFDDEVYRRAYLERYFPPGFLDTSEGNDIETRAGYWFRGRHRFIATYLSQLVRTGFMAPHSVLNDLVDNMTGFRPSGWSDDEETPVKIEVGSFNFASLAKKSGLLAVLGDFVLDYIFTGKIRRLGGPIGDAMVEFGVSRFKKDEISTDEPLAILALVTFFQNQGQTLEKFVSRPLNSSDAAYRGVSFEAFGAYLLARAFSTPKPLSDVFEFVGGENANKAFWDEPAELVTLEMISDKFQTTPCKIHTNIRSRHLLGCSPPTSADTLKWLQNPQGTAFCYPFKTVGPDLIFVLRLINHNTVLRVCVRFKHTQGMSPKESEKAIRTTEPAYFFSEKRHDNNSSTCSDSPTRDKMIEELKRLGEGTNKAGPCGLLRRVISHPTLLDDDALEKEAAMGHHPLATVPIEHLESPESELGQMILSLANQALQKPDLKRKGSDGNMGSRPKRHKGKVDTGIGGSM